MSPTPGRRRDVDLARGLAVLLMIEAHTTDAWTRAASKTTAAFRDAVVVGGFAAPLFLWVAGIGVVLSAERALAQRGSRGAACDLVVRRGLEIFILAFLFRLQAFVLSPGGPVVTLFRVDILNIMGLAIAGAGLLWWAAGATRRQVLVLAAAAAVTALVTPLVRASSLVDALPVWVQWHVRSAGEQTTFTAFPWVGFVFGGGAVGAILAAAHERRSAQLALYGIGLVGLALVVLGVMTAARPTIYASASFWTSSPTWFAIRLGVLMITLPVLAVFANLAFLDPISRLGRSSLFVYWIHVELVYGYASWLWRGRLPLWATLAACSAFSVLMYGAVVLRDRCALAWQMRRSAVQSPAM